MTRPRFRALALSILAMLLLGAGPVPRPQVSVDAPVDIDELLQAVRIQAGLSTSTFYKYTYRQSVTDEEIAEDGTVTRAETRVYQVIPSPQGTERHLISREGRPPSQAETRKQEKRNEMIKRRVAKARAKYAKAAERKKRAGGASTPAAAKPATPNAPPTARAPVAAPATPLPAAAHPPPPEAPAAAAIQSMPAESSMAIAEHASEIAPMIGERAATPAPLPPCVADDPESSLRPPLPGSVVRTRKKRALAPEEARRARDNTAQYSLLELLQLTDYELAGACESAGRSVHVLTFEPPESFDPMNPVERVMTAMSGTLMIDGNDLQVMRAEAMTVAPIKWGAGMVALKSAHVVLEYSKVNGEIWLPSRDVFEFDTRVLLGRQHQRFTRVFDEFRKATVEVETEYEYRP